MESSVWTNERMGGYMDDRQTHNQCRRSSQLGWLAKAGLESWTNWFQGEMVVQPVFARAHPAHQWTQCPMNGDVQLINEPTGS